jgi:hypothetical protein
VSEWSMPASGCMAAKSDTPFVNKRRSSNPRDNHRKPLKRVSAESDLLFVSCTHRNCA